MEPDSAAALVDYDVERLVATAVSAEETVAELERRSGAPPSDANSTEELLAILEGDAEPRADAALALDQLRRLKAGRKRGRPRRDELDFLAADWPDEEPPSQFALLNGASNVGDGVAERIERDPNDPSTFRLAVAVASPARARRRKRNEVDRLLMDEGAVNMLYGTGRGGRKSPAAKARAVRRAVLGAFGGRAPRGRPPKRPRESLIVRRRSSSSSSNGSERRANGSATKRELVARLTETTELRSLCADGVANVVVKPTSNSIGLYDSKVLRELYATLIDINKSNVRTLVLTSDDGGLCNGLDLRDVLDSQKDRQKIQAYELLSYIKNIVTELCNFKGALIIGVDGACRGFGVGLLPLADLVIASERASFCVCPNFRCDLPPEGASILNMSRCISPQLVRELIYCNRDLSAADALECGLITRTVPREKFTEELSNIAKIMSQYPSQSFEISKTLLRHNELMAIEEMLNDECNVLLEFWCSTSGQEAIQKTHSHL